MCNDQGIKKFGPTNDDVFDEAGDSLTIKKGYDSPNHNDSLDDYPGLSKVNGVYYDTKEKTSYTLSDPRIDVNQPSEFSKKSKN